MTVGLSCDCHVLTQAVEAIECYLEGLLLDSEPIPTPKNIAFHKNNPDYADGVWETVSVDLAALTDEVVYGKSPSFSNAAVG